MNLNAFKYEIQLIYIWKTEMTNVIDLKWVQSGKIFTITFICL